MSQKRHLAMDKLFLCNINFYAKPISLLQGAIAKANFPKIDASLAEDQFIERHQKHVAKKSTHLSLRYGLKVDFTCMRDQIHYLSPITDWQSVNITLEITYFSHSLLKPIVMFVRTHFTCNLLFNF